MALSKLARSVRHVPAPKKSLGAGDAFALVAKPIAKVIDAVLPTDVVNCATCGQRQDAWNAAIPDIAAVPGHAGEILMAAVNSMLKKK